MHRPLRALGIFFIVAITAAACTVDDAWTPTTVPSRAEVDADVESDVEPGIVVSDDPRGQEIAELVEAAVAELELQTVVFGVWDGDTELVRGAIDAPGAQPPTSIDAKFRVGQPLEAMLGTVLLQLGSEGVIDLDAPVEEYLPELVNSDRITPRMLINSTGGTPDYVTNENFIARVDANPFGGYTFEELLGFAQETPPLFEPGTSWAYSHTEMAAVVELLEVATGESFEDLMAERIFEPLGMHDSSARQDNAISEPMMRAFSASRGVYEETTFWDPTWGLNGGVNGSVADLGRWLRALNSGELLDPADAEESLSPVTAGLGSATEQRHFTYGSLVDGDWILGNPSLNGYMGFTAQQRDPSITIVVWSTVAMGNPETSNASVTISQRIAELLSDTPFDLSRPG